MRALWTLYHQEIPSFLRQLSDAAPLTRLQNVGMNCGCEYTKFPRFLKLGDYSRFDHSLGVALIVWHFTNRMDQAMAGLFHDVTTPVFAHVVDFLNGDHLRQESTEAGTAECLAASPEVAWVLDRYGIEMERISDYHRYPIADNEAPALSADRLEYTLGNLLNYGFADTNQIKAFYEDLEVGEDEQGRPELVFKTPAVASAFAFAALKNSNVYVADEDRFAMQALADILKTALERKILRRKDLQATEGEVIWRLEMDPVCNEAWQRFCSYGRVLREAERPENGYWVQVNAKKRWIDPLVRKKGRVSQWDGDFQRELEAFQALDFSCWLSGEPV